MTSRTVTIRGLRDAVLRRLRSQAATNRRSLNSELLLILERASEGVPAIPEPSRAEPVLRVDRRALAAVCRRHRIRYLALFGSQARGEAGPGSDVDVLVEFEPGETPGLGVVTVAEELQPAFGGRRVDLVTLRGLLPANRERILAEAVPLHGA